VLTLLAAVVVGAAIIWAGLSLAREIRASRAAPVEDRTLRILELFAPGLSAVSSDPRELLTWQPLAEIGRQLFPQEFTELDRAAGGRFPFTNDQLQAAHSRWTAEWLAWEQAHDVEFKLKAATAESELAAAAGSPQAGVLRARLDAVEREKLERYQRRYEEYVRVAKGLQALIR
jgi:hypothetical protein